MAESEKIRHSDFFEGEVFSPAIKDAKELIALLDKLESGIKGVAPEIVKALKGIKDAKTGEELAKANKAIGESEKARKLLLSIEKQEAKIKDDLVKKEEKLRKEREKSEAQAKRQAKIDAEANRLYNVLSKRLNDLRKDYKDLAAAGLENEGSSKAMLAEITKLDKKLKDIDASTGQYNREVGNYTNKVKDAINASDLFGKAMSGSNAQVLAVVKQLNGQYRGLRESIKSAESVGQKLNMTLKAGGIAALIAVFASLSAAFKSSDEGAQKLDLILNKLTATFDVVVGSMANVGFGLLKLGDSLKSFFAGEFAKAREQASQGVDKITTSFDGFSASVAKQIPAMDALTLKTYQYRDAIRTLEVSLLKVNQDMEDFTEISNDSTLPLQKQKDALEETNRLRRQAARLNLDIANKNLDLARDEIEIALRKNRISEEEIATAKKAGLENIANGKLAMKINGDLKEQIKERIKTQLSAEDQLADLPRKEAEENRKRNQQEIIDQIELLRSKKLGADQQIAILEKQVADERVQLEEREILNQQRRDAELRAQTQEFDLFQKGVKKRIDFADLVATKDSVELANRLKLLRLYDLSEAQYETLAKVVKEAQENEQRNNEILAKQQEERIAREEKIAAFEREIALIQKQTDVDFVKSSEAEKGKVLDEANKNVLVAERVFNRKLIAERKKLYAETEALLEQEYQLREEQLKLAADNEISNIKSDDAFIRAEEEKKIQEKLNADLIRLELEHSRTLTDAREKELDELEAIQKKKISIVVDNLAKVTQATEDELDRRFDIEQNARDRELGKTSENIDRQRELAEKGLDNELAFQESRQAAQELAKRDAEERAARQKEALQLTEALFNAYNARLNQPNSNPVTAAAQAVGDVLLIKALAKGLFQFAADGNNMIEGPGTTTSDSIPYMLSRKEAVIKAKENIKHNDAVVDLNAGVFAQKWMHVSKVNEMLNNGGNSATNNIHNHYMTSPEVVKLLKTIAEKPVSNFEVNEFGEVIEKRVAARITKIITHKTGRGRI